jgi:hypothetical protein
MPRPRPRQVAQTDYFSVKTQWFIVAHNDDPSIPVTLRVYRPAGGRHKATLLGTYQIPPGTLATVIGNGEVFAVPAYRQLYATILPPIQHAGARIERFSDWLISASETNRLSGRITNPPDLRVDQIRDRNPSQRQSFVAS